MNELARSPESGNTRFASSLFRPEQRVRPDPATSLVHAPSRTMLNCWSGAGHKMPWSDSAMWGTRGEEEREKKGTASAPHSPAVHGEFRSAL